MHPVQFVVGAICAITLTAYFLTLNLITTGLLIRIEDSIFATASTPTQQQAQCRHIRACEASTPAAGPGRRCRRPVLPYDDLYFFYAKTPFC